MKLILTFLTILSLQTSFASSMDSIPGKSSSKRIVSIDIDLIEETQTSYKVVFKSLNNIVTVFEYNISALQGTSVVNGVTSFSGNIPFKIKVMDATGLELLKTFDIDNLNKEVLELDRLKAELLNKIKDIKKL